MSQFGLLMQVLHDMLDQIERQRLGKMLNELPDEQTIEKRSALYLLVYIV